MIIADQCKPTGYKTRTEGLYIPKCEWPEDCYVQWGSRGIVVSTPSYETAFFEAFPKNPSTFIRGEGKDVAEAEQNCYLKFLKRLRSGCKHEFERREYRNGGGICKHCGLFQMAFEPLEHCCICDKTTYYTYGKDKATGVKFWYCEDHANQRPRNTQPNMGDMFDGADLTAEDVI